MDRVWISTTTSNPLPAAVVYVIQQLRDGVWEDVWHTTNYLQGLAWAIRYRREKKDTRKIRMQIKTKNLYQ